MKQEQQQKARQMYFQTEMSKTEIAEKLNVSRRSVFQWSVDGDWEKLKASAQNMPSMLAEKCYYLIGHFTDHLLSRDSQYQSVTKADAEILYKLTKTVGMLKKGSTINEDMETFNFFLDGLQRRDATLAEALMPYADEFVSCRAAKSPFSNVLSGFTKEGFKPLSEKEIMEKWLDEQDAAAILQEMKAASAVETQDFASPHNTEQDFPSPHNTEQNNTGNNTGTSSPLTENTNPKPTPPAPAPRLATGSKNDKNYKTVFWENKAREKAYKEAAKARKAA